MKKVQKATYPATPKATAHSISSGQPIRKRAKSQREAAHEALLQTQQKFETMLNSITDGLLVLDHNWRYTYFSETGANMVGMRREDLIGKCVWDLFPHAKNTKFYECYHKAVETGETITFEEYYPDPLNKWLDCRCYPSPDGLSVYFHDITERKQSESQREAALEALQQEQLFSKSIIDSLPMIFFLYSYPECKLVGWNKRHETDLGYTADELKDLYVMDFHTPEYKELVMASIKTVMESGYGSVEDLLVTKDGRKIPYSSTAARFESKDKLYFMGICEDITERKAIEAGLEKTRQELAVIKIAADEVSELAENVINTVREPLIALDQDLRVVKASSSFYEFFKVEPENIVGQLIYDLGNKQWDIPKLRELLETILPQKTTFDNYEVEHDFATIGKRTMLLNARQIQRVLGKERIILLAIEDITERKRAEDKLRGVLAELERSNNDLEQFASIASHDLQEPLRMVASYTQLLAERYEGQLDEKARKYIAYAVEGAIRMQRLVNDLLAYSRVSTRGNPLETTDSHSILGEVIRNLAAAIEESKAIITNEELPMVRADASQLMQLFQNLLTNAIKFRGENFPLIHVSARDEGCEWVFSVRDNGIGIERQYAERIFVIFQRLHTRQEYPGTGIGLAVCKRILERHGGRIWFESESGKGSTFFFTIPK